MGCRNGMPGRKKKKPVRKESLRTTIESNVQTLHEVRVMKDKLQRLADLKEAEERGDEDVVMDDPLPDIPDQPDDPPRPGYWLNPEDGIKNSSYMLNRPSGCSKRCDISSMFTPATCLPKRSSSILFLRMA